MPVTFRVCRRGSQKSPLLKSVLFCELSHAVKSSNQIEVQIDSPTVVFSVWEEHNIITKCLSLAVLLPSGVGLNDFTAHVWLGGCHIELILMRPTLLWYVSITVEKWPISLNHDHIERCRLKFIGFENFLKQFRDRSMKRVPSVVRAVICMVVWKHVFFMCVLCWKEPLAITFCTSEGFKRYLRALAVLDLRWIGLKVCAAPCPQIT